MMRGKRSSKRASKKSRRQSSTRSAKAVVSRVVPAEVKKKPEPSTTLSFITADESKLIDLAIDVWKLEKNLVRALDLASNRQLRSSLAKLTDYLKGYEIETRDYDGEKYHPNLNLKILSAEEQAGLEEPIILETVRPAVLKDGMLRSHAAVILAKPVVTEPTETTSSAVEEPELEEKPAESAPDTGAETDTTSATVAEPEIPTGNSPEPVSTTALANSTEYRTNTQEEAPVNEQQ